MSGPADAQVLARGRVRALVAKYQALTPAKRRAYNETATRNDFIDPLFEALGWNMHDNAEVAREVTVGSRKRVDYAFRIRGVSRFLLEAKALNDPLDDEHVRQAIDYAWNADVDRVAAWTPWTPKSTPPFARSSA